MEIVLMKVDELIPYENNPRKNDHAVDMVAKSIDKFGFKVPIVVDSHNEIVTGHTRLKAAYKLGIKEVPVIVADDLTNEQVRAFRLADNKVSEFADWDEELLKAELSFLNNMDEFGFSNNEIEQFEDENPYTQKVNTPVYEPQGVEVDLGLLVNTEKTDELVRRIQMADLPTDVERFLILGAQRHLEFNYKAIAEYYAQSDEVIQDLIEQSAMVIIDFQKAIENGYLKLTERIQELVEID